MPEMTEVALWGPTSAGKTVFLAQLFLKFVRDAGGWVIGPTQESEAFLEIVQKDLHGNRFPGGTAVVQSGAVARAAYLFRHEATGREAALTVEDWPGKDYEALTEEVKQRLNRAAALMLLFDPAQDDPRDLERLIVWTLRQLSVADSRGTRKDRRPIAICFSKCDLRIDTPEDLRRAIGKPREFVLEKINPELEGWIKNFCENYEVFPVSSVGVRLRHGVVERSVFYDESPLLRIGSETEPINMMKPLLWIFDQLEREAV